MHRTNDEVKKKTTNEQKIDGRANAIWSHIQTVVSSLCHRPVPRHKQNEKETCWTNRKLAASERKKVINNNIIQFFYFSIASTILWLCVSFTCDERTRENQQRNKGERTKLFIVEMGTRTVLFFWWARSLRFTFTFATIGLGVFVALAFKFGGREFYDLKKARKKRRGKKK